MKEFECPAVLDNLRPVLALSSEEMIACSTLTGVRQRLFVVLEELFVNSVTHAYAGQATPGPVRVRIVADEDMVTLRISDRGSPFNPLELDDARRLANLENMQEGGAGLFLVKTLSQSVEYEYASGWNCVTVVIAAREGDEG